ncbi:MAG: hypothetical protein KKE94_12225 [Gammaproteobacteria bacterium]|nr:hypothetical protein [Gammaproteobacteria bacterium]
MKAALLLVLLLLPPLQAAPLRLKLQQQQDSLSFHYQFDINGQRQQLSFNLSHATLAAHFPKFRALKPTLMQHYLWRDLQRHVARHPGISIQRLPGADSLTYRLSGKDNTLLQQLQQELATLLAEQTRSYLQREYYQQVTLANQQQVLIPDHQRLMQDSLPALLPVATALHQEIAQLSSRQALGYISQWLQQIPYQDLSDRQRSSGASFSPPLRLLRENRGDCDSKAVLLAGLLRLLMPSVKLAIVYLPGHAMLAVQLPTEGSDTTVSINGVNYILVDATGPALQNPGQIASDYRIFSQSGAFTYQSL